MTTLYFLFLTLSTTYDESYIKFSNIHLKSKNFNPIKTKNTRLFQITTNQV